VAIRKRDLITCSYRKLMSLIMGRPSNFSYVEEKLAASGYPYGGRSIRWLKARGIDAVISLTEEPIGWAPRLRFYANLPLQNDMPASPEQLLAIAKEIDMAMAGEGKVLVHCAAGKGRTGMALAAHMVYSHHISADSAIDEVIRLRPGSLSRLAQRDSVKRFAGWLQG